MFVIVTEQNKNGHGTFWVIQIYQEHKAGHNHKYATKLSTGLSGSRWEKYQMEKVNA